MMNKTEKATEDGWKKRDFILEVFRKRCLLNYSIVSLFAGK